MYVEAGSRVRVRKSNVEVFGEALASVMFHIKIMELPGLVSD